MAEQPSPVAGFRLALRLHKLVLAAWLVSIAVFLPAQLMVDFAAGPTLANLPEGGPAPGDTLLIQFELLRPIVVPLALALILGCVTLAAWSILWHAGTVRWWLGAGAARVHLSEILGHGVVWWWRYARLAVVAGVVTAATLAAVWLPVRTALRGDGFASTAGRAAALVVAAIAVSLIAVAVFWTATLRGGWLLGESGRRSALVAWLRGFGATLRRPLRSLLPLLVWGVPGLVFLTAPLLVSGVLAAPVLMAAALAAACCWVALYLSYAPREPNEEWYRKMQARAASRVAAPPEKPDAYRTTRFPTQPPLER
jgi:hypothetical protein